MTIVGDNNLYINFLFTYADTSDFYVGQTATIFINGMAGTITGTVTAVSSGSTASDTGKMITTVRVKAQNPGLVTSAYTASAVIGSYSSYGNASIEMGESSTITAETSGKVTNMNWLAGDAISSGDQICTITGDSVDNQIDNAQLKPGQCPDLSGKRPGKAGRLPDHSPHLRHRGDKIAKAGDKIEGGSTGTLCTIYDLSYLEMTMNIDELDIGKVEVGQTVEITADAVEGQTYTGVVTKVSVAGTTTGRHYHLPRYGPH